MRKRLLTAVLCLCMALTLLPAYAAATETEDKEQFDLKPGKEYYYFYIEEWKSYVRFNYAGTVDAYVLNSRSRGKTEAAEEASKETQNTGKWYGNTYTHSLFIARGIYLARESWDALNGQGLIFGKTYEINGVKYTMRAPTVGSNYGELEEGWKVTPENNEWDAMLNKGISILYAGNYASWGQDTAAHDSSFRAARGGGTMGNHGPQRWDMYTSDETGEERLCYRPVLEVMNAEELGRDGLKAVTLQLNGGAVDGKKQIQIIVKNGAAFTAPVLDGIGKPNGYPEGYTEGYFEWLGNDGNLYAPGDSVPAAVTELKAQWNVPEQFSLEPGETYYFDLSKKGLYTKNEIRRGEVYDALPDKTLHYVPFTYAGTVDAYVLNSHAANVAAAAAEASATTDPTAQYGYTFKHSLFIADYILRNDVSWKGLSKGGWIFGKRYDSNGILYTMRAPTVGSSGDAENNVTPENNEWDAIADKNSGYIENWANVYAWGQDSDVKYKLNKAVRGLWELRRWRDVSQGTSTRVYGYRPVLEVKNADTLGPEALKVVTLQLEEANVGGKNSIKIIVRSGQPFTAPSCEGLTVAEGYDRASFRWKDSDGNLYAPGDSVPAAVTELKAQWSVTEQFSLEPGGTYYFDLSEVGGSRYQAFTYAGTVGAYRTVKDRVGNEHSGNDPHTLFVSESITKGRVPWHTLNGERLIFGRAYASSGVEYAMRAPTGGNGGGGNNEWDRILVKDENYIKGGFGRGNWCQDKLDVYGHSYTLRGNDDTGVRAFKSGMGSHIFYNYRPVLEVMNAKALGQNGLKAVTLQLNGGAVDGKKQIQIIVKNGAAFTAPVLDGIGKPNGYPEGYTEGYFEWLGNDGKLYAPGAKVPATVDTLTAQWKETKFYTVTYAPGPGPEDGVTVAGTTQTDIKEEGQPLTLRGALFTCEGYRQIGWIESTDGTDSENDEGSDSAAEYALGGDYEKDANVTLYPVWEKVEKAHEHTYAWFTNIAQHWKLCTDPECPDENRGIKDEESHRFAVNDWEVTIEPTETSPGEKTQSCTIGCGYVGTQEIPATGGGTGHVYLDKYEWDERQHWKTCADPNCKDEERILLESHELGEWKVTTDPTATDPGEETRSCICGYSETRATAASAALMPGAPGK